VHILSSSSSSDRRRAWLCAIHCAVSFQRRDCEICGQKERYSLLPEDRLTKTHGSMRMFQLQNLVYGQSDVLDKSRGTQISVLPECTYICIYIQYYIILYVLYYIVLCCYITLCVMLYYILDI